MGTSMKKLTLTRSIMVLVAGIVIASCSKTDVFEQNQANYGEQQKSEYKANYVAKYGQPDANQSWDFAALPGVAKTRAGETMTCNRTN
jgi:outer membrane PBP1 activator LpoA protein